ncbi:MAG: hypothetical protein HQM12_15855 [SAR324 cluster bacterium]|nr:hypothetical protein [SAR324 cluster bacterium]
MPTSVSYLLKQLSILGSIVIVVVCGNVSSTDNFVEEERENTTELPSQDETAAIPLPDWQIRKHRLISTFQILGHKPFNYQSKTKRKHMNSVWQLMRIIRT